MRKVDLWRVIYLFYKKQGKKMVIHTKRPNSVDIF